MPTKFSEFSVASLFSGAEEVVGLQGGLNKRFPHPLSERLPRSVLGWMTAAQIADVIARTALVDVTTALNTAAAANAGGAIWLPPGNYQVSGKLSIPPGTAILGPGVVDIYQPGQGGATIYVTHTDDVVFSVGRGVLLDGFNMFWPNQVTTSPPTAYDWAIQLDTSGTFQNGNSIGCTFRNLTLHNTYKGIDLGGDYTDNTPGHGSELLERVNMYALHTGVRSASSLVEWGLSRCVFSPQFWTASVGQAVRQWVMTDGNACIAVEGLQAPQMTMNTYFGHRRGLYLSNPLVSLAKGAATFFKDVGSLYDGLRTCVEITDNMSIAGGNFVGCHFAGADAFNAGFNTGRCVYLNDCQNVNTIGFDGCTFVGTQGTHFEVSAPTSTAQSRITIGGATQFLNANRDNDAGSYYNILINDSRLTLAIADDTIFDNANETNVTNVRVVTARNLRLGGVFKDTATVPFNITAVGTRLVVGTILSENLNAGTWPAASSISVASAATVTLPESTSVYIVITGTTGITSITPSWPTRTVILKFNGSLTVTDGGNLKLNGNFVTSADDTLTLVCDGTNWYEIARSAN